jgi:hypothetical protein
MNIKIALAGITFIIVTLFSMSVYAWTIQEDHGSTVLIRCSDGSNSTVTGSDGNWTVLYAGKKGNTGGRFGIVGQAALYGCGE